MKDFNLSWTKYAPLENEATITDPLAFDYFAQILGNIVLPSFTTRTSRARYYSMVCYGIYISRKYLMLKDKPFYEKDILEIFKLYEKFWARAIVENYSGKLTERDGKERELRGKRGALKAKQDGITTLGKDFKFLTRQLELGGLGAYRTSMEALELVDSSLNLTHKGEKLAKFFVDTAIYDNLLLKAINEQKIVEKEGRASLNSFGYHTSLDGFTFEGTFHAQERELLREYIMDNPKNNIAINYILKYYDIQNNNVLETIERIVNSTAVTDQGQKIVEGYKTILAFENLAVVFNRLWCAIIKAAEERFGTISVIECALKCKEQLNDIFESNVISELVTKSNYSAIIESYHGVGFQYLLSNCLKKQGLDYVTFIIDLVKNHNRVMDKRSGGSWIAIDGINLIVMNGYDYPKKTEKLLYLHSYKVPNIMTLIKDTGWQLNGEIY